MVLVSKMKEKSIICIDLKSFFASCECLERGINTFSTPLVVCNPERNGAITLAVTPYLKQFGVKGRTRVYELPKNINIIKVPPRMSLYIQKSKEVIETYLEFVSSEDIHIYSIDEVFIDVTNYLNLYKKDAYSLALDILNKIKEKNGLTATAGIGPNMLLAKVAMDIEAKHTKDNIAHWTYNDIKTKLWNIKPLSNMWGIGTRMEKRLNKLGIFSIKDLATYNKLLLKEKFGIIGEELWNHANGIDNSTISDYKKEAKDKSYSHSQILYKDYDERNIKLIIKEMCIVLARRLRENKKNTSVVSLHINYSKNVGGGFSHMNKLETPTDNEKIIADICFNLFDQFYEELPIRKVGISVGKLSDNNGIQLNLFEKYETIKNTKQINNTLDEITNKFGKNSILPASSLLKDSTLIERNKKIGGHNAI